MLRGNEADHWVTCHQASTVCGCVATVTLYVAALSDVHLCNLWDEFCWLNPVLHYEPNTMVMIIGYDFTRLLLPVPACVLRLPIML